MNIQQVIFNNGGVGYCTFKNDVALAESSHRVALCPHLPTSQTLSLHTHHTELIAVQSALKKPEGGRKRESNIGRERAIDIERERARERQREREREGGKERQRARENFR